jgi:uncharacterized protein (DUF1499 family)
MASIRTLYAADQPPSWLASWASRVALFAVTVLVVTLILHRLYVMPTALGMTIANATFLAAVAALVMAAIAGLDIWVTGRQGAPRVIVGSVLSLALLAIPAAMAMSARQWPAITDVTTDPSNPPDFRIAETLRGVGANPIAYRRDQYASKQAEAYPDLKPLEVPRSAEDAFEQVVQALGKLHLKPVTSEPPSSADAKPGHIELTDYTMLLGLAEDVAIRVTPVASYETSIIDIRSASRYGDHDFGRNAERVREIMREIVGRLEASVPSADAIKAKPPKKPAQTSSTKQRERDPDVREDRKRQRPAQ